MVNRLWANNQPQACFTNLQLPVLPLLNKDQATKKASHSHCSDGPQIHHHPRNQRTQTRGIARLASGKRTSLLLIQSQTTSTWIYSSKYLSNKRVKTSNRGNRETCQVQSWGVRCTLSSRRHRNRGMSRLKGLLPPWPRVPSMRRRYIGGGRRGMRGLRRGRVGPVVLLGLSILGLGRRGRGIERDESSFFL